MPILITRPYHQAKQLQLLLEEQGFSNIVIEPMLTILPSMLQAERLEQALEKALQAIIITSSNGIDALAMLSPRRDIPIVAVGEASRQAAELQGFTAVSGGGTAERLLAFLKTHYSPSNGALLYLSGEVISTDFTPALSQHGFDIERISLYHALPATSFSYRLNQVLIAREPLAALFYSERTARIFSTLAKQGNVEAGIACSTAFALSPAIAAALEGLPWKNIKIATEPTQEEIIALLVCYVKESHG